MRPTTVSAAHTEAWPISSDPTFTDCVVLDKDTFDPDAVFLEDIVDDDVLPSLSLAVEGLTDTTSLCRADLELSSERREQEPVQASTALPAAWRTVP